MRRREREPRRRRPGRFRDLDVGSLPICGEDNRLKGMVTDRDIVTKGVAEGRDPAATVRASSLRG